MTFPAADIDFSNLIFIVVREHTLHDLNLLKFSGMFFKMTKICMYVCMLLCIHTHTYCRGLHLWGNYIYKGQPTMPGQAISCFRETISEWVAPYNTSCFLSLSSKPLYPSTPTQASAEQAWNSLGLFDRVGGRSMGLGWIKPEERGRGLEIK